MAVTTGALAVTVTVGTFTLTEAAPEEALWVVVVVVVFEVTVVLTGL